ncbi:hypothetical protein [Mycolicibacterium helvum]|uniref:Terminase n=1 Tax=Mycolicibacterium helvum TaxID=1534349 RepID=A0A7I7T1U1_9MYCO|nr:hypothetical protein [Mycolicibacterium helvum]BBY62185.1 hypothetical protein MHEL_04280 [Mycolicibacterium helvum]
MPDNDTESPVIPRYPTGLKTRGKRLWREMHESGDFSGSPETVTVIEEACYLADEIARQRRVIRRAGDDTRVSGYNGQPDSMPEIKDVQRNQQLLLAMLKAIRVEDDDAFGRKLTRSEVGRVAAAARYKR